MPEYVYALHDFLPEHEDEVSFRQGERIEVVEKDDMYSDGWWQGRNLAGKVGLFPQTYTTAAPPSASIPPLTDSQGSQESQTSSTLQPLPEESETSSSIGHAATNGNIHAKQPSQGDEVMKATMTDVQKAIEQLGRNNGGSVRDDRSFSFASTKTGDADTDTDIDMDTDRDTDAAGDDWHRDARVKLAEQARKVVAAQKKKDEEEAEIVRSIQPPIEVELSDESEGEDDEDGHRHRMDWGREHPHIPEEDEDDAESQAPRIQMSKHEQENTAPETSGDIVPVPEGSQPPTATANRTAFPNTQPVVESSHVRARQISVTSLPTPTSPGNSPHAIPPAEVYRNVSPSLSAPEQPHSHVTPTPSTIRDANLALPSPAASYVGQQQTSKHNSLASSGHQSNPIQSPTTEHSAQKKWATHPSEWTVEDVVDWLRSKGFGDDVCDRFIEQEITGDVLLDLDVNLLKSELGIPAFGKRMRIANYIADLRRPPSIVYSDGPTQSTSISQSQSQPYGVSHSHSQSVQSSAHNSLNNSPFYPSGFSSHGLPSAGFGSILSAESPLHTGDLPGTPLSPLGRDLKRASDPVSNAGHNVSMFDAHDRAHDRAHDIRGAMERSAMVGLGVGVPAALTPGSHKNRPAQLMLSPSDSNLVIQKSITRDIPEETEDDRGVASENETASSPQKRYRMFERPTESGSSTKVESTTSKNSKDRASLTPSPHPGVRQSFDNYAAVPRPNRRQKSLDNSRSPDRLSLFSSAFSGSIGKSRKPAPRYSSFVDQDSPSEKQSTLNLSRLYAGKKVSGRPITSDVGGTPIPNPRELKDEKNGREKKHKNNAKENDYEKDPDAPTVLRKRTSSNGEVTPHGMQILRPGQSVIEQIGEPDHKGWMRKKGDRYNSWKSRYFVLKGPHLYILKGDDRSETKIKGYINIVGYKVLADENTDPGRYGFRIMHDTDKMHFFSSAEQNVIREWMKAIMKATIGRDYSRPVVSSCNIPTIPLTVAQAMSPAPRPPSPSARAATQKAHRQDNPNQLSSRDARILMGLPSEDGAEDGQPKLDEFFANPPWDEKPKMAISPMSTDTPRSPAPPRPSREMRKGSVSSEFTGIVDIQLIEWANSHLPKSLQITDPTGSLCSGLALLRLAESIRGKPSSPPVPDSAFPSGPNDDKLDGLFKLFDFLLDNDVKTGSVSINEVRQGQRDKIVQLLRALKSWDDKRRAIEQSLTKGPSASYWAHV